MCHTFLPKIQQRGRVALADIRRKVNTRSLDGKSRRPRDGKGKVVWPGAPRRRPTGDQDSLCQTGKPHRARGLKR